MSFFKTKKFYVGLLVVVALSGYGVYKHNLATKTVAYDTIKVERGTLLQTVDATGQIQSANDISLKFEIPGILSNVNVKEGDTVKAGQLLGNLRLTELNAAVAQAQANLNKQLAGSTPDYIAQLQASLDKAKNDLNQAQGSGDGVENSKLVQNSYDDLSATLQSVQVTLSTSMTAADNILGVDNTLANSDFVNYLSISNSSNLNTAKLKYSEAKKIKSDFDLLANFVTRDSSHTDIDQVAQKGEEALLAMKDCLFYVSSVLDNTPPVGAFPQSSLDLLKTNIQGARTTVTTKYASLLDATHAIVSARNNYSSLQSLVDKAQAALKDAQNPPREVDVASYRAALEQAVASRDKAIIKAPIDGIITQVNNKVGETMDPTGVAFELLSPHYEIQVDVSETDIAKLKLDDAVAITLDAFGEDVKFSGKVINIDPGSTVIQDVVYYTVKISLDDSDKPVKPGMTANVTINTDKRDNALIIPSRAVRTDGGKFVNVLENNQEVKKEIKLGIKGNDGKVEVLDGLDEGQQVILGLQSAK